MLLEGKNAVIYGAGGPIGGAAARTFAREGATVFLTGRTREKLDALAGEIRAAGGAAETARVDAHPVHHRTGRGAPHGPAAVGRDPRVRGRGRPPARLLHRRHAGRVRGGRDDAAADSDGARPARCALS
jgi:NAD(P)-dependent dehydrogenase (short-subunit alcohol dehydrogenase family)